MSHAGSLFNSASPSGQTTLSGPSVTNSTPAPGTQGAQAISGALGNTVVNGLGGLTGGLTGAIPGFNDAINNTLGGLFGATQDQFVAQGANLQAPTNAAQLNNAYNQSQAGLGNQQALVNALQQQNGIQNQSNVYNQLGQVANGQGPNPAQAQLAQATGQNVSNQNALMAGQRGATQNTGLIARQAAQQGANTQQNAIGQGAALQAQQSLNALNNQAGIAQNQVNQLGQGVEGLNTSSQNEQNQLLNANSGYNSNQVGMQSNLNNVNAQISQGNQAATNGLIGGMMQGGSSILSNLLAEGGEVEDPQIKEDAPDVGTANLGASSFTPAAAESSPNIGSMNAIDPGKALAGSGSSGGGGGGGGGLGGLLALLADGGDPAQAPKADPPKANLNSPKSKFIQYLNSVKASNPTPAQNMPDYGNTGGNALYQGISSGANKIMSAFNEPDVPAPAAKKQPMSNAFAGGGKVPALVSPGEQYLKPDDVKKVAKGANPLAVGEKIPGKPQHPGNDYRNDTVPKTLEAGGIVIPNKVLQSKNPHWEAMRFVHAHMKKNRHS